MKEQVSRKYVRECFKSVSIQLSESALDDIIRNLRIKVGKMAQNCKDGNVKRLTSDLMFIALGKLNDFTRK